MPGTRTVMLRTEYEIKRDQEQHKKRLQEIKGNIDNATPESLLHAKQRSLSPAKINVNKAKKDEIARQNLQLAKRIFNIMEGDGSLAERMHENDKVESHPGTMNFTHRLKEAQKIHEENMILATRLDNIKGYYRKADLTVVGPHKKKHYKKKKTKKTRFAQELAAVMKDKNGNHIEYTSRSDQTGGNKNSRGRPGASGPGSASGGGGSGGYNPESSSISRNRSTGGDSSAGNSQSSTSRSRPQNVLLEYTKIQEGKVLDVAVMKEPFRDRYAIFGIDIDEGQRYELKVTSEEVSNILDGDMLVTSVENVEVWMALLNKVSLNIVDQFSKLSSSQADLDSISSGVERGATAERPNSSLQAMRPVRPSSEHKTARFGVGEGSSRSGRSMVTTPITERNENNGDGLSDTPATASFPINAMNDGNEDDETESNFPGDFIETARPFSAPRKAGDNAGDEDNASKVSSLNNEESNAATVTARPGSSVGARPVSSSAVAAAAAVDNKPETAENDTTQLPVISSDSQNEEEEAASKKITRLFKNYSPQKDAASQKLIRDETDAPTPSTISDDTAAPSQKRAADTIVKTTNTFQSPSAPPKKGNSLSSTPGSHQGTPRPPLKTAKAAPNKKWYDDDANAVNPASNAIEEQDDDDDEEKDPSVTKQTESRNVSLKKQPIVPSAPSSSRSSVSTKGGTFSGRYGSSSKAAPAAATTTSKKESTAQNTITASSATHRATSSKPTGTSSSKAQSSPREPVSTKEAAATGSVSGPGSGDASAPSSKYNKAGGVGASTKGAGSFKPSAPNPTAQSNSPRLQQYSSSSSSSSKSGSSSKTAKINVSLAYSVPASAGGVSAANSTPAKSSKNKSPKDKQQQQQQQQQQSVPVHSPRTMEHLRSLAQQTVEDSVDTVVESMTTAKQTVDDSIESVVQSMSHQKEKA